MNPRVALLLASVLGVLGCKDRSVDEGDAAKAQARTECDLLFECECGSANYADEAQCVEIRTATYDGTYASAKMSGLRYDGTCVADYIDAIQAYGCDPPEPAPDPIDPAPEAEPACERPCLVYHGSAAVDEPCFVDFFGFSSCAQGLVCDGETCTDPCAGAGAGLGAGEACREASTGLILGDCAEGLYCDSSGSNTCVALPGEGAPCPGGECAPGLVCRTIITDSTCFPLGAVGDECSDEGDCKPELACEDNECIAIPELGQPCNSLCADGLLCYQSSCVALPGDGESCLLERCAEGLVCSEESCVAAPGDGEPCIGGACAEGLECSGPDATCARIRALVCGLGW